MKDKLNILHPFAWDVLKVFHQIALFDAGNLSMFQIKCYTLHGVLFNHLLDCNDPDDGGLLIIASEFDMNNEQTVGGA